MESADLTCEGGHGFLREMTPEADARGLTTTRESAITTA